MQTTIKTICAAAALVVAFGALPASAASLQFGGAQVQNAQFMLQFGNDDGYRSRDRDNDGRFERRGSSYYYNGHRGYRERRTGFRYYNGFWFPQSAFSFSFSVGNDRGYDRGMRLSERHVEWCQDHYRSYRTSDNSFQPYNGPRQECLSPYSG